MLFQCRPTVLDAGPTLKQHWVNSRVCWDYNSALDKCDQGVFIDLINKKYIAMIQSDNLVKKFF